MTSTPSAVAVAGQQQLQNQLVNFGLAVEPQRSSKPESHTFEHRHSSADVAIAVVVPPNWLVAPAVKLEPVPAFVGPALGFAGIGVTAEAGSVEFSAVA